MEWVLTQCSSVRFVSANLYQPLWYMISTLSLTTSAMSTTTSLLAPWTPAALVTLEPTTSTYTNRLPGLRIGLHNLKSGARLNSVSEMYSAIGIIEIPVAVLHVKNPRNLRVRKRDYFHLSGIAPPGRNECTASFSLWYSRRYRQIAGHSTLALSSIHHILRLVLRYHR